MFVWLRVSVSKTDKQLTLLGGRQMWLQQRSISAVLNENPADWMAAIYSQDLNLDSMDMVSQALVC